MITWAILETSSIRSERARALGELQGALPIAYCLLPIAHSQTPVRAQGVPFRPRGSTP